MKTKINSHYTLYKESFRIAWRTEFASIINTSLSVFFREILSVLFCENQTEHTNNACVKN
jgi:hypothetical protein